MKMDFDWQGKGDKQERGIYLIDILFAILFFGITALGIVSATVFSIQTRDRNLRNSWAMQIALDTLEDYAAWDPETLSEEDSKTDYQSRDNVRFRREMRIAVNKDTSRTVRVSVTGVDAARGGKAELTNNFALWGAH